ncbi:hypothetical protein ACU686_21485 [Yinghuangia aomiensis]
MLLTVWLSSEEGFNSGTWTAMAAFGGISVTAFVLLLSKDALLGNFRYRKAVAVGAVVVLMAAVVGELALLDGATRGEARHRAVGAADQDHRPGIREQAHGDAQGRRMASAAPNPTPRCSTSR